MVEYTPGATGAMLTAVGTGSPFSPAIMLRATSRDTPSWASTVEAPKCGVMTTLSIPLKGLISVVNGSSGNTSTAAPATLPLFKASARA